MWRVKHFDISVDNPERAMTFYQQVFGWNFDKWKGPFDYWLVTTGNPDEPGIDGGLARREDPNARVMNFIEVPSIDECVKKITASNGKILQAKQAIPGIGYIAVFQDTEMNLFGLMQTDVNAQ